MDISHICAFIGASTVSVIIALLLAPDCDIITRIKIDRHLKAHGINLEPDKLDEFIEKMKEYFHITDNGNISLEDIQKEDAATENA